MRLLFPRYFQVYRKPLYLILERGGDLLTVCKSSIMSIPQTIIKPAPKHFLNIPFHMSARIPKSSICLFSSHIAGGADAFFPFPFFFCCSDYFLVFFYLYCIINRYIGKCFIYLFLFFCAAVLFFIYLYFCCCSCFFILFFTFIALLTDICFFYLFLFVCCCSVYFFAMLIFFYS